MKRGVINLRQGEAIVALGTFTSAQQQSPLYNKLVVVSQVAQDEKLPLQLSEEEVELLLDNIGIPIEEESPDMTSLRTKLRTFLQYLRQGLDICTI